MGEPAGRNGEHGVGDADHAGRETRRPPAGTQLVDRISPDKGKDALIGQEPQEQGKQNEESALVLFMENDGNGMKKRFMAFLLGSIPFPVALLDKKEEQDTGDDDKDSRDRKSKHIFLGLGKTGYLDRHVHQASKTDGTDDGGNPPHRVDYPVRLAP